MVGDQTVAKYIDRDKHPIEARCFWFMQQLTLVVRKECKVGIEKELDEREQRLKERRAALSPALSQFLERVIYICDSKERNNADASKLDPEPEQEQEHKSSKTPNQRLLYLSPGIYVVSLAAN